MRPQSDDQGDVGALLTNPLPELARAELRRLDHREPELPRAHLHRRGRKLESPPCRLVGLTDERPPRRQSDAARRERRHRKPGDPKKSARNDVAPAVSSRPEAGTGPADPLNYCISTDTFGWLNSWSVSFTPTSGMTIFTAYLPFGSGPATSRG